MDITEATSTSDSHRNRWGQKKGKQAGLTRLALKLCFVLIGMAFLAAAGSHSASVRMALTPTPPELSTPDATAGTSPLAQRPAMGGETTGVPQAKDTGQGLGAGNVATAPADGYCDDNIFIDSDCWIHNRVTSLSAWLAQKVLNALRPLIEGIVNSSLNFLTHTPAQVTYAPESPVQAFAKFSLTVVDAALAVFVLIAGYNVMLGRYIGLSHGMAEYLPRIILAVIAAHFSLLFVQWLIDLNNELNTGIILLQDLTILTHTFKSIFSGNIVSQGWVLYVLALIFCVMTLLLAWQMLVRLAFLMFLIGVAPLGIACFALPQTENWGRLWVSNFATTVFVQFFQVTTLALGSVLLSQLLTPSGDLVNLIPFASDIPLVTSVAVFFLVLKIPGMLRQWALRRVADGAEQSAVAAAQGAGELAAEIAPRLLALF